MVIRILIFLMLLTCTAYADISGRIDSMMIMAFEQSLVPDNGNLDVDTSFGQRAVNRGIQRVCYDFPAIEKTDTVISVKGTIEYALNTDFLRLNEIFKLTTASQTNLKIIYSLSFPPVEGWFESRGGQTGGEADPNERPEPRYAWAFNDNVYFYPTPQSPDSFIVSYYAIDSQIVTSSNSTSVRPEYREAIVLYAASLICYRKGDFTRAQLYEQMYQAKLGVSIQIREPEKQ